MTQAQLAALAGCKQRTVETALPIARRVFPWFDYRKVEGGTLFAMGLDGIMSGKIVDRYLANAGFPKESTKESDSSKERLSQRVPTEVVMREKPPETAEQLSDRLRLWLRTLSPTVILFGVELGLTRREVLATAERFVKWYTAHPERAPRDLDARFCDRIWLERDAARKLAKRGKAQATAEQRGKSDACVVFKSESADDDADDLDLSGLNDLDERGPPRRQRNRKQRFWIIGIWAPATI